MKTYPYTLADGRVVKEYKREEGTKYLYLLSCSKCGDESWGKEHSLYKRVCELSGVCCKAP